MFNRLSFPHQPPPLLAQSHLPSLDGLRGLSILFVITGHVFEDPFRPFFTGGFGVTIFFVISGFLITLLLLKEKQKTGTISLRKFYIRRFLRIFPVAYLFLVVTLALNWIFKLEVPPSAFVSAALYLQNTTLINTYVGCIGHYWSLSVEEQFYLIFPFFLKANTRVYFFIVAALIFIIPAVNLYDHRLHLETGLFHFAVEIFRFMVSILIGSLFSVLLYFGYISVDMVKRYKLIINIVFLLTAGFFATSPEYIHSTAIGQAISNVLIALILVINLKPDTNLFYRMLNSKVMVFLGLLSYSIYIWQQIFTYTIPWKDSFPGSGSWLFNLPILFVVSYCSYHFYEKKFLKLKERFKAM